MENKTGFFSVRKITILKILTLMLGMNFTTLFIDSKLTKAEPISCRDKFAREAISNLIDRVGFNPVFKKCYYLENGETEDFEFSFTREDHREVRDYLVIAECDNDCYDVDLSVYNDDYDVIDQDYEVDPFAEVKIRNIINYSGITIEVTVAECENRIEECVVVVGLEPLY